jgi:hypothetical protein
MLIGSTNPAFPSFGKAIVWSYGRKNGVLILQQVMIYDGMAHIEGNSYIPITVILQGHM